MKKIMALLIALVLMLPCIAIADENVKITVAILRDVDDHSTSFADKELVQQACATTGVDVVLKFRQLIRMNVCLCFWQAAICLICFLAYWIRTLFLPTVDCLCL